MIYVFYIHSSIVSLIAQEVIKYEKIDKKNIVIILYRNYKLDFSNFSNVLDLSFLELKYQDKDFNISTLKLYLQEADSILNKYLKENFIAYMPNIVSPLKSLIVTHKNCLRFNYVEEGLAVYVAKRYLKRNSFIPNLKLYFRGLSRIKNINERTFQLDHPKLLKCYTVSPLGFKNFKNKVVLQDIFKKNEQNQKSNKVIIVFDALLSRNLISEIFFFEMLINIIAPFANKNYQKIYYKFHPEQYENVEQCNKIMTVLNNNFTEVKELQASINLEKYILQNHIDVINYISSVGFYASLTGNKVFSVISRVESKYGKIGLESEIKSQWIQI